VVKRTVDEATSELTVALPEAKLASEAAMRRVSEEPDESVEVLEAELSVARMAGLVDDLAAAEVSDDELDQMLRELGDEEDYDGGVPPAVLSVPASVPPEPVEPEPVGPVELGMDAAGSDDAEPEPVQAESGPAADGPEPPAPPELPGTKPADGRAGATAVAERAETTVAAERAETPAAAERAVVASAASPEVERVEPVPLAFESEAPASEPVVASPDEQVGSEEGETGPYVDELFARIRAGRPAAGGEVVAAPEVQAEDEPGDEPEAAEEPGSEEPVDPEVLILRQRDAALATVERELGRRLKRVLADEQNEVLDLLRRGKSVTFADVVPAADEHADRFAIAAGSGLDAAAAHGAARVGADATPSCDELAGALGRALVDPLRQRIERSFDDCDGNLEEVTERLRALYREWKGQHIGAAVRHYTAAAYAWGAYEVAPDGSKLRWLVDRTGEACPDADDNALAGPVAKGTPFPTGDRCSPAHPGCRCLVLPADLVDQS
jgi:hypothetical protein